MSATIFQTNMIVNMEIIKITEYLVFVLPDEKEGVKQPPKTKLIAIINKHHNEVIGEIKWFSKWRQYCFYPTNNTIWNKDCLNDVNSVITKLMEERKNANIHAHTQG